LEEVIKNWCSPSWTVPKVDNFLKVVNFTRYELISLDNKHRISMEKYSESSVIIRFPDCDPFNHLNNSRYIDYFINAREDHLIKDHHFNIYAYAKEKKLSWVVSQNQVVYLKPAILMETVVIQTGILKLDEKQILVEMQMLNKEKTTLKALLWTRFVHFNFVTQKSETHSPELMAQFKPFENTDIAASTFEARVQELLRGTSVSSNN
jgi:YbgC/YbaW family acyl-CoA thioester hydrolase